MEKAPAARYARASELGRDLKVAKAYLPIPTDAGTLFIDQTVLHTPSSESTIKERRALKPPALMTLLAGAREISLGRPLLTTVVLLLALAAGTMAWHFWPVKPVVSTPGLTPATPGTSAPPAGNGTPAVNPPEKSLVTLRLNSRPPAAKILVNGRDTGKTTPAEIPIEPSQPPPRIQLEMSGFKTEDVSVTPDALRGGTLDVVLSPRDPAPRVILVATGEYKFDVMDRQRVLSSANERHDIAVTGLRSVQLRSDRYFLNQTVRVDRGEAGTVKASAPPLGTITVYASGALEDCKVFIDDRIVDSGSFPVANREIASGVHRVKLSCSRGETDPQTVNIVSRQNTSTLFPANTPVRPR